jgi:hypothetical protein
MFRAGSVVRAVYAGLGDSMLFCSAELGGEGEGY